jgi:hypothetical protein
MGSLRALRVIRFWLLKAGVPEQRNKWSPYITAPEPFAENCGQIDAISSKWVFARLLRGKASHCRLFSGTA